MGHINNKLFQLLSKTLLFALLALCAISTANAAIVSSYFAWNYVDVDNLVAPTTMELTSVTYEGASGTDLLLPMPVFSSSYTDGVPSFIGEFGGGTTSSINTALAIDWMPAGADTPWSTNPFLFPTIGITAFSTDYGSYDFNALDYYVVGLIPVGLDWELYSMLSSPQGDVVEHSSGAPANPAAWALDIGTGAGNGDEIYVRFAASASIAQAPVPAAVWLFGSGLLCLIGVARRKVRV